MGVPKFFRYISERYPCLSELVKEFQIPDFDNLYLDMNGIIHGCSHPNDFEPHFSITEEKIFASIFHYIEVLFNLIKPRKLFFMAVDGVAPRAKMNQQRARRFRTAKEAENKDKEALEKDGKPLPKERFDSNCITPGTVFMDRLHSQLKYFITSKISTDPLWQGCKIILSGHQTPGEGEHKIMDYIRYLKTLPEYDDNTRHCLYGLDADLIMLGLCTHEPHFSLLREKVLFSKQKSKRMMSPDETEFYLLHLSILREYLDLEFQELKDTLPFQYNLENIIDDWVLMGFLVGNDFIPNLPDLHINKEAFPILFKTYKEVLPTLDGYLNENGYLNLPRFERYMQEMAKFDLEVFEEAYANLSYLEEKMGRTFLSEKKLKRCPTTKSDLEELIKATEEFALSDGCGGDNDTTFGDHNGKDDDEDDEDDDDNDDNDDNDDDDDDDDGGTMLWEFSQHKKHYYTDKLDYRHVTPEVLKSQAEGYIRAIQWNLHYYYQGCQSWSWYYPHHYSPYISDINNFKDLQIHFDMGKPFLPFEQLLAVLPAASKDLLPEPYHHLMTSPDSPIKDFYPNDFETDLNGKDEDWEAVVLIPFIDEKRLLDAMKTPNDNLTPDERRRNQHGPMHVFTYTDQHLGLYKCPAYFPDIPANHALMQDVSREEIHVDLSRLKYGLRPGALVGTLYPGYPTLTHIPLTAALKEAKVKVFDWPSRRPNMILTLVPPLKSPSLEVLAKDLLGKVVYANWPHLVESKAVAVSDGKVRYSVTEKDCMVREVLEKSEELQWVGEVQSATSHYGSRLGVEIGVVKVMVYALSLEGRKYIFGAKGKVSYEKVWSGVATGSPLQTVVRDVSVEDHRRRSHSSLQDAFPKDSVVFMLGQPHFGSMGRVLESAECCKSGRLNVALETVIEPILQKSLLKSQSEVAYFPCKLAAQKASLSCRFFSRITGAILVSMTNGEDLSGGGAKVNIGLNMKFYKKNEELLGYTRRQNDNWLYSMAAIDVVCRYVEKFTRVMEYLANNQNTKIFFVQDIFPGVEGATEMKEMVAWVKKQDYHKVERSKCGTEVLSPQTVSKLEEMVERQTVQSSVRQMKVKPHLLYKSDLVSGNVPPVQSAKHLLLDRVVSIRSSYTVPTGLRGYIIGIHPAASDADYMYDILFDQPFVGGTKLNSSSEKVFRMSRASFLNITDASRQSARPAPVLFDRICPNNVSLRPCYGNPKTSAFVQWTQQCPQPSEDVNNEFKEMWTNLQRAKPQEDALKKILKIDKTQKTEIEEPVKWFFEKITKVSKECSPTPEKTPRPFIEPTPPKNKYHLQLLSFYQKRNLGQPRFKYFHLGGKVMAQVFFSDGRVYSGLPCEDKESACESAALQALGALGEVPLNNEPLLGETPKKMHTQPTLLQPLLRPKPPPRHKRLPQPNNKMPLSPPNPPSQWVLNRTPKPQEYTQPPPRENFHARPRQETPEKSQIVTNSGSHKLNVSALEFVPLQAMTGKRSSGKVTTTTTTTTTATMTTMTTTTMTTTTTATTATTTPTTPTTMTTTVTVRTPSTEPQKKTEVVATFFSNEETSPSTNKPKRKLKIAAKLDFDLNLY